MNDDQDVNIQTSKTEFREQVNEKAVRKLKAQRHATQTVWSGFGMMGLVGWSVVVPTLLGAALGISLDERFPGGHSWTLALLAVGLGLGCLNAWRWVAKEGSEIREQEENHDE
jgi:ATP synthase protein I